MTFAKTRTFIEKHEWIIPLGLFILFLALTLPGISWGAPNGWHPDEIVGRSIKASHGEWKFSETNFDYPDLPQYTMFFLGKLLLALGKTDGDILVAARVLSAGLAGLTVVLTYIIARRIGGSVQVAGLSGLFLDLCQRDVPQRTFCTQRYPSCFLYNIGNPIPAQLFQQPEQGLVVRIVYYCGHGGLQ